MDNSKIATRILDIIETNFYSKEVAVANKKEFNKLNLKCERIFTETLEKKMRQRGNCTIYYFTDARKEKLRNGQQAEIYDKDNNFICFLY